MSWGAFLGAGTRVADFAGLAKRWESDGVEHLWTGEVAGIDAVTAAAVMASSTTSARVGLVWNAYLRSVALSAMSLGALADLAPARLDVALGVSSPMLVEGWHGVPFERPVDRMVGLLTGLRSAFAGERLANGFRLDLPPEIAPRLILASTGPRMLREAGPLADGVMVNWCTADDLSRIPGVPDDPAAISGLLYVCPTTDAHEARAAARKLMGGYLSAPGYAALQRLVGRGAALAEYWRLGAAGDRRGAASAIPDETIDELVAHGSPATCRARIAEWERRGMIPLVVVVGPPEYQSRLSRLDAVPTRDRWTD